MNIEKTVNGTTAVISLEGWLDTKTAPELEAAVSELPAEVKELTLDLAKTEYISSAGLRQIVAIHKKMDSFIVKNVSPELMEIFKMTGINNRLNMQ